KIFVCRPSGPASVGGPSERPINKAELSSGAPTVGRTVGSTSNNDEGGCARRIITTLASHAFRRPAAPQDVDALMRFYQDGRKEVNCDYGIEMALARILA